MLEIYVCCFGGFQKLKCQPQTKEAYVFLLAGSNWALAFSRGQHLKDLSGWSRRCYELVLARVQFDAAALDTHHLFFHTRTFLQKESKP